MINLIIKLRLISKLFGVQKILYKKFINFIPIFLIILSFNVNIADSTISNNNSANPLKLTDGIKDNINNKIDSDFQINIAFENDSLSINNLLLYLKSLYDASSNSFVDSQSRKHNTTVTTARSIAILKMTGLMGYVIPEGDYLKIFEGFGSSENGGYKIHQSTEETSIVGTYGVVLSAEMLNLNLRLDKLRTDVPEFILSKYVESGNSSGFKEDSSIENSFSIKSTYYAVHTLSILDYKFNQTVVDNITNFLKTSWNPNLKYFNSSFDLFQSEILTTFQALSILYFLNQTNSIDIDFWNEIKNSYPSYLMSRQETNGSLSGGIASQNNEANVDDTGLALSSLLILNPSNLEVNYTNATLFILKSQFPTGIIEVDKGGFSFNNNSHIEDISDSGVRLSHTYNSILGLYSNSYLFNNTNLEFETDYSKSNKVNDNNNEILPGHETFITTKLISLDDKSYYQDTNISFKIDGLDVVYNKSKHINSVEGFEFTHKILNSSSSNWTLGSHNLESSFSLNNFSILPNVVKTHQDTILIRLPLTLSINSFYNNLEVEPGTLLEGKIEFENNTINKNYLGLNVLGNFSIDLIYPNSTILQLNSSQDFIINISTPLYYFNYTIPEDSVLGDYYINISYINGTEKLFYSQQIVKVNTELHFVQISSFSLTDSFEISPNDDFDLNFTIQYENGMISSDVTSIKAKFYENQTNSNLINVNLTHIEDNIFRANKSEKVPIDIIMGLYNITIELIWNSSTTNNSIISTITNSSLPFVKYTGKTIFLLESISPYSNRNENKVFYSGDFINITAKLGLKSTKSSNIYLINESTELFVKLVNTSNIDSVFQSLSYNYVNNSVFTLTGEINPNINHLSDVNFTLSSKIKYKSTGESNDVYNADGTVFNPNYLLKKADIQLEQNSVKFLTGGKNFTYNSQPTMIINFKVLSAETGYVTGLNLNASLIISNGIGQNDTVIVLPAITSLQTNKSYQLFVPLFNLNTGIYEIQIKTSVTDVYIGSIEFEITPEIVDTSIPIESVIFYSVFLFGIIITILNVRSKD